MAAGAVVLAWATVASAFKIALSEIGVPKLLLISSFTALVIFGVDILIKKKVGELVNVFRQPKTLFKYGLMGMLNPVLYYIVLFMAYSMLPAMVAQPLNYSWQILLILLAVPMLGAKVSRRQVAGLVVSFGGIVLISMRAGGGDLASGSILGIVLALMSAIVWATYWTLNSKDEAQIYSSARLFVAFLFAMPVLVIYCGVDEGFDMPSMKSILSAVYVGCLEMGITFILWSKALEMATSRAAVTSLTYLSPVISLFILHFVVGEDIRVGSIIGLLLIIAGIVFVNTDKKTIRQK